MSDADVVKRLSAKIEALEAELAAERERKRNYAKRVTEMQDSVAAAGNRAVAAEAERDALRAELAAEREAHEQQWQAYDKLHETFVLTLETRSAVMKERDALRAALVEARDRLIEEGVLYSEPLVARIDNALRGWG